MQTADTGTFLGDITLSDIECEGMQMVAMECGIDDALTIMAHLPGLELYIPASAKKGFDWEYVKENYTGYNAATIAGHLGLNREDVIQISKQSAPMGGGLSNGHVRLIADKCGSDIAERMAQAFPGYRFYVPTNGLSVAYRKYIERNFNGTNTQELALKCGVSERYVRKVISEKHASSAQLSFIDKLIV